MPVTFQRPSRGDAHPLYSTSCVTRTVIASKSSSAAGR